jgi:hypothetical protein
MVHINNCVGLSDIADNLVIDYIKLISLSGDSLISIVVIGMGMVFSWLKRDLFSQE